MKNLFAFIALLVGACFSTIVCSQEMSPGFHTHDGFYLSMAAGLGGGNFQETNFPGGALKMSG